MSAGLTTENAVFMLKAYDVETRFVEKLGGLNVFADRVVVDMESHRQRLVIGVTRIVHGDDAGLDIRASCRDGLMKIMGKGRDPAAARKMIADKRNTLERAHCFVSTRPSVALARVREVANGTSSGRLAFPL